MDTSEAQDQEKQDLLSRVAQLESQLQEARQAATESNEDFYDAAADDDTPVDADRIRSVFANSIGSEAATKLEEDAIRAMAKRVVVIAGEASRAKKPRM